MVWFFESMHGINPVPSSSYCGLLSCPRAALVVVFLALWALSETTQRDEGRQPQDRQGSIDFAATDLAKSVLSLFMWVFWLRLQSVHPPSTIAATACSSSETQLPTCNGPFHEQGERFPVPRSGSHCRETYPRSGIKTLTFGSVWSTLSILVVALIYTLRAYIDLRTWQFVDPLTLHLAFPVTLYGTLVLLRIVSSRKFPSSFWHGTILQFAGFFITRGALVGSVPSYDHLWIAFALCNSMWISFVDLIYGLHRSSSVHLVNTMIVSNSHYNRFASALQGLPLIEAARDVTALFIIQQYGAVGQGILVSLASTLLVVADTWRLAEAPSPAFLGCLIAILGCGIFILGGERADERQHDFLFSVHRCLAAAAISLVTLGYVAVVISLGSETNSPDFYSAWKQLSGSYSSRSDCRAPEPSNLHHAQTISNYTHFNNILLVVFFSHARYDANLDFHKEVYADYFPNIIYIGPASREDKGFAHSYDVLVDSFQSDEDLTDPSFYKMSGRMAHHMLYTALREHGCYDGYLWAPFDTLLNIPRLQQFNQSLFWYHSPWGQPVPNPALGELTEPTLDISRHAPPAMISPDTSINLTETWRGWGPDWWWGDPHVGVSTCMSAFRNVPEDMRAHLAERNNGQTRLIGGSADTLYIPGRHRKVFMDVLALFLETNCFLEIATPTTVHLVVPPGEPIQFVDHWWIYQPPFNALFVRQKWAEGYEVDTFHTFHWGERGEDGVWRGDHRHVADVRRLLRESAHRQGLNDTFPVNLDDE